jgi:thimet oligopeptidase
MVHFIAVASLVGCATHKQDKTPVSSPTSSAEPKFGASHALTVSPEQFTAECQKSLEQAREAIVRLKSDRSSHGGNQILTTYDLATAALANAAAHANLASNVHPDPSVRLAAEGCEQQIDALSVEISLDRDVYDALASVPPSGEGADTRHWLERTLLEFRRAGVDRDAPIREKVRGLSEELVRIGQDFSRNIRDDVRTVELDPKELAGLPEDYVTAHPPGANGKVAITTNYPDYFPFMTYASSTKAREALWRAYRLRGYPKNEAVLAKLIEKRHALATLLGYPSWAAYATEDKMTKSEKVAGDFIEKVSKAAEHRAQEEYAQLLKFKRRISPSASRVEPWEQEYLEDQFKSERFGFDSQSLRPYFEYSRVKQGVMDITSRMFGISYQRVSDQAVWHPDVETYDVLDGNQVLGRIYLDMHPREGKYKHAAQFPLSIGQRGIRGPEGVLVCNFPKPGETPALMQHSEVETFFHEFGHLLHHVFAGNQRWATVSGVRTEWDFVEVPSMLLQEWASDPQTLSLFARHYQTGATIPSELVQKLRDSREFGKALYTRRQMFLSALSLELHNRPPGFNPTELAFQLQEKYVPFRRELVPGAYFHLSFGHLEGYSAIYYTYAWSVVIAKDLLTVFQQNGMLDPASARRLRAAILEPGGSKEAALLVRDFLGRDYNFKAYENWLNRG